MSVPMSGSCAVLQKKGLSLPHTNEKIRASQMRRSPPTCPEVAGIRILTMGERRPSDSLHINRNIQCQNSHRMILVRIQL